MIKIEKSTIVTFPIGSLVETSMIIYTQPDDKNPNQTFIVTESTPFHPVDNNWPDQPADHGVIQLGEISLEVIDVLTGAINLASGSMFIDKKIKDIRRGEDGWAFFVVHVTKDFPNHHLDTLLGKEALLKVDHLYRKTISASHTACHLMALALNKITKAY